MQNLRENMRNGYFFCRLGSEWLRSILKILVSKSSLNPGILHQIILNESYTRIRNKCEKNMNFLDSEQTSIFVETRGDENVKTFNRAKKY